MLKKNFYFYYKFYYETAASRAVIHVSCPQALQDKSDIQKYVPTDFEDKTFTDSSTLGITEQTFIQTCREVFAPLFGK
jgi:hypothetical protein